MLYYIISFLLSAGISLPVYLLLTRGLIKTDQTMRLIKKDQNKPKINRRPFSYIILFSTMFGSLFIILFGGSALCFFIQSILFIKPAGGYPLQLDSSEVMIIIPISVVAIFVMCAAVSMLPEIKTRNIKQAKKSFKTAKQIITIELFICLLVITLGIHNYAYVINDRITLSSSFSFEPKTYNVSDIKILAITTNHHHGIDTYSCTIFFPNGTSMKVDLYDLGYIIENIKTTDITFDTHDARSAYYYKYGTE